MILHFAGRNLKLFFRDKGTVFFSLLGPIIIIVLYIVFLKNTVIDSIEVPIADSDFLVNSWIMAGIVASAAVTTCLAGYGIMIRDRETGLSRDFDTAPVGTGSIMGGYMLASALIGSIMSMLTLILMELYTVATGGNWLGVRALLLVLGLILLSVFSAAGILGFCSTLIGTQSAFSGGNIAIGAAIGFLVGAYIPVGTLPVAVQNFLAFLPCGHSARLMRQVMMDQPMSVSFQGASASAVQEFDATMGRQFTIGSFEIDLLTSGLYLALTGAAGFALMSLALHLKRARK